MTNPPLALRAPMNFSRPDPADFSVVERAVLQGLEVDRLDFSPTAPRRRVLGDWIRSQQELFAEEEARVSASREG
jgi:hypothetical protein